jgi:hypothetical protein
MERIEDDCLAFQAGQIEKANLRWDRKFGDADQKGWTAIPEFLQPRTIIRPNNTHILNTVNIQKSDLSGFEWRICVQLSNGLVFECHSKTGPDVQFSNGLVGPLYYKENFYDLFLLKWSRLVLTIPKPDKFVRFLNGRLFCFHLKTGPKKRPENYHSKTGQFSVVHCTMNVWIPDYSQHLKSGPSGFRMVIFRTQFVSGF